MWEDDKVFRLGRWSAHTTRATDPVKWCVELHKNGQYWESKGSRLPFRWLAALSALLGRKSGNAND